MDKAIKVALIEDDPAVMADLRIAIEGAEDMVLLASASDFRSGSKLVDAGGFDVLMCDLGLPDGDGTELVRQAAHKHPSADVVVLTMFAEHARVLATIKAGASGYLLKDRPLIECIGSIREIRNGGSPINPVIARLVLKELQSGAQPEPGDDANILSERELQTLQLLSRGFSYAECADLMQISAHTVATFVKHIYRKLEVHSRAEAVFEASSRGILNG